MRRFLDYYRQFEELAPEEVSRELRERRDEEKARALAELPALDLASPAWHEPPHPEIVNAATFALRRAVNAYPDAGGARAARSCSPRATASSRRRWPPATAPGELLRAACHALLASREGRDEVAGRVAGLGAAAAAGRRGRRAARAGAPRAGDGAPDAAALWPPAASAPASSRSAARTTRPAAGRRRGAAAARARRPGAWILLDAALADFGDADLAPLTRRARAPDRRPLVLEGVRHGGLPRGLRGRAARRPELLARLAPVAGVSAPAQAGMAWAVEHAERLLPRAPRGGRRRARAAGRGDRGQLARVPGRARAAGLAVVGGASAAPSSPRTSPRAGSTSRPGTAWGDERHVASRYAGRRRRSGWWRRWASWPEAGLGAVYRFRATRNEPRMNGCTRQK